MTIIYTIIIEIMPIVQVDIPLAGIGYNNNICKFLWIIDNEGSYITVTGDTYISC